MLSGDRATHVSIERLGIYGLWIRETTSTITAENPGRSEASSLWKDFKHWKNLPYLVNVVNWA